MESTKQRDRVNGHSKSKSPQDLADVRCTPPRGEIEGSDSTSVSDLQELKGKESEDEEEKDVVPPSKGLKGDQKENVDQEENNPSNQNSSASTAYTGTIFFFAPGKSLKMVHGIMK